MEILTVVLTLSIILAFDVGYRLGCSDTKSGVHLALVALKASIKSVDLIPAINNMLTALKPKRI